MQFDDLRRREFVTLLGATALSQQSCSVSEDLVVPNFNLFSLRFDNGRIGFH
jgi:hypothetical protein